MTNKEKIKARYEILKILQNPLHEAAKLATQYNLLTETSSFLFRVSLGFMAPETNGPVELSEMAYLLVDNEIKNIENILSSDEKANEAFYRTNEFRKS